MLVTSCIAREEQGWDTSKWQQQRLHRLGSIRQQQTILLLGGVAGVCFHSLTSRNRGRGHIGGTGPSFPVGVALPVCVRIISYVWSVTQEGLQYLVARSLPHVGHLAVLTAIVLPVAQPSTAQKHQQHHPHTLPPHNTPSTCTQYS